MSQRVAVTSSKGLQTPLLSQAIVHDGKTVYASGNVGIDPETMKIVEGGIADRTRQAIKLMQIVLEEAGSGLDKILKCNIFITSMQDYAAMNKVWLEMIPDPKPARTCVAVAELPFGTDVEIECTAHL